MREQLRQVIESIKQTWQSLRLKDSFARNSAFMFSASAWGIVIQFVFSPILSRIYSPEAYGVFSILNSCVVVIGIVATLGYHQAFVLPKSSRSFRALLGLSIRSTLIVSSLTFLVTLAFSSQIMDLFGISQLGVWIYLTAPLVLLLALDQIVVNWAVRHKKFKEQSLTSIPINLGSKLFNVSYGFLISSGPEGLILTTVINYALRILVYLSWILDKPISFLKLKLEKSEVKEVRTKYSSFPKYVMWGNALNMASNYLPLVLFPMILGSAEYAGLITFATLSLDIPVRLLGAGITPVFLQKAAVVKNEKPEELAKLTWRLFKNLLVLAALPLFVLYVFATPLYEFVFGSEWTLAGRAAEILVVYYFFRLISAPISSIFNIVRKERQLLIFQIILFIARLASILIGAAFNFDFISLLIIFSASNAIVYLVMLFWIFKILKYDLLKVGIYAVSSFSVVFLLAVLVKHLLF